MNIGSPEVPDGRTTDALRKIVAGVTTGYHTEHTSDDGHATITATGSISERNRATPMGEWIPVLYSALNFTAGGTMTWTVENGDQSSFRYTLVGKTLFFQIAIITSSVGGVADVNLVATIPGSFSALGAGNQFGTHHYYDNGTPGVGLWASATTRNGINLNFYKTDLSNWTASANASEIRASGAFEIAVN